MSSNKLAKEKFVTDLSGSTTQEIINIMLVFIPVYYTTQKVEEYAAFNFILHFVIPLFMVTVYNDYKLLLYIFALTPLLFLSGKKARVKTTKSIKNSKTFTAGTRKKGYLTAYRSHMLIMTAIAILAVDFKVFPRKLGKVETWGTSLMDLGVGSFIFSSGIVSRPKETTGVNKNAEEEKEHIESKQDCIFARILLRKSNVLFVLGLLRLFFVKNLEYQEHITEYGKHWNFFITLGLMPLTQDLLINPLVENTGINRGLLGVILCTLLEVWMNTDTRVLSYLINADRAGILGNNREGIYSLCGYIGIFLLGQEFGRTVVLPTTAAKKNSNIIRKYLTEDLKGLCYSTISIWALLQLVLSVDKFYISRRFANLPYVLWVVSYNLGFLTLYCVVDRILNVDTGDLILECINNNGLLLFLLANVSTGIVNMSVDTLSCSPFRSILILLGYCGFLLSSAIVLNKYKIRI